jgi:hypothetical protein
MKSFDFDFVIFSSRFVHLQGKNVRADSNLNLFHSFTGREGGNEDDRGCVGGSIEKHAAVPRNPFCLC